MSVQSQPICCLCGEPCEPWPTFDDQFFGHGFGHNPAPLGQWPDRCCNNCNETRVIPARIELMTRHDNDQNQKDHN